MRKYAVCLLRQHLNVKSFPSTLNIDAKLVVFGVKYLFKALVYVFPF